MANHRQGRSGQAILEFTLVGIPMIFVLVSVVEMARGMWVYNTLAHAVKEGTRLAIVNGANCAKLPTCLPTITVGEVAERIRWTGVGLSPDELEVTLVALRPSAAGPVPVGTPVNCNPLRTCLGRADMFPPADGNRPKVHSVSIQGVYPFRSAIAMFWPGAGRGMTFGTFRLPASSVEVIQF